MLNLVDKKNGILKIFKNREQELMHSIRVANYGGRFGKVLGLDNQQLELLQQLCLYHDCGKAHIPKNVLEKRGPLNPMEDKLMKKHTVFSEKILMEIPELWKHHPIVRHHHEKWDGSGYPDGLRGDEIPILSRIIALVDVYDALTSERPYRDRAFSKEEAFNIIHEGSMKHFDGRLLRQFLHHIDYITEPREETYKDIKSEKFNLLKLGS